MTPLHIPKHGLNIQRSQLPQIKSTDVSEFIQWIKHTKHVQVTHSDFPVAALYPSQGEFNQIKIRELMKDKKEHLKKPVIISADHYLLDGHHRWLALLNMDSKDTIPAIVVHMKILDLLAATKEFPKSFTKTVVESFINVTKSKEPHEVLAFGRMNPPTAGHEKVVNMVHHVAALNHASHKVILSHKQDKDNPLPQDKKIEHAKIVFPATNIIGSSKEKPSLIHHATDSYKSGIQHLHVVMGDDRVDEFRTLLNKYNGKFDKNGNGYDFKSITVHSAGSRDKSSDGVEGISSSKMREYVKSNDFSKFKKGLPSTMTTDRAKELFADMRKHTSVLEEETQLLTEGVHDASIFKAVFLAGGSGSGKDFILKKALDGHGLVEINSDKALEFLMDKHNLDKKMPEHEHRRRDEVRGKAKSMTELRQRFAIEGRNGIIINSTSADAKKLKRIKDMVDELGYDSKMVFVDVSDDVSRQRNVERGQRGGRMVPEKIRSQKWKEAQDARVEFSKLFGTDNYHEIDNNEDLRANLDPEVHKAKGKELLDLFKTIKKFTQTEPKHPKAQEWIQSNLGKLAKKPIGNKKQQASTTPPSDQSEAAKQAREMGLQYYGFGRYGKNGKITHFSLHDKLVEKSKIIDKPKQPVKESLDDAFSNLLTEGEPVLDSGEEGGPILGMDKGEKEVLSPLSGGKATSGPKKTFRELRTEKK